MDIDKATTYCFQTTNASRMVYWLGYTALTTNADTSLGNTVIGVLFRQNTAIMVAGSQRLGVYAELCL